MMIPVKISGNIIEQSKLKLYDLSINFTVPWEKEEDVDLDFAGYLAKPTKQSAISSFTEKMMSNCYQFSEDNNLSVTVESEDADPVTVKLEWEPFFRSVMDILVWSINELAESDEAMFLLAVGDKELKKYRKQNRNKTDLLKEELKKDRELDIQLAKLQATIEAKQEVMEKYSKINVATQPAYQTPLSKQPQSIQKKRIGWSNGVEWLRWNVPAF